MTHSEVTSEVAYKVLKKHKGKAFVLMAASESYVVIEKQYFLNDVLKYDINRGMWAKWTLSTYGTDNHGALYIERTNY